MSFFDSLFHHNDKHPEQDNPVQSFFHTVAQGFGGAAKAVADTPIPFTQAKGVPKGITLGDFTQQIPNAVAQVGSDVVRGTADAAVSLPAGVAKLGTYAVGGKGGEIARQEIDATQEHVKAQIQTLLDHTGIKPVGDTLGDKIAHGVPEAVATIAPAGVGEKTGLIAEALTKAGMGMRSLEKLTAISKLNPALGKTILNTVVNPGDISMGAKVAQGAARVGGNAAAFSAGNNAVKGNDQSSFFHDTLINAPLIGGGEAAMKIAPKVVNKVEDFLQTAQKEGVGADVVDNFRNVLSNEHGYIGWGGDKNYYDVLGVPKGSSPEEIRGAYKDLSKKNHPDKGGSTSAQSDINEAYLTLRNPSQRTAYDKFKFGKEDIPPEQPISGSPPPAGESPPPPPPPREGAVPGTGAAPEPQPTGAPVPPPKEAPVMQDAGLFNKTKKWQPEVRDAFQTWVNTREAGEVQGAAARQPFESLRGQGLDALKQAQSGSTEGSFGAVRQFFDNKFAQLKEAGVKINYRDNYIPQLWKNDPAEVNRVFNKTASEKDPGFTLNRLHDDYEAGIKAGLTPRFDNIPDLVGWYEKQVNKALSDKQFLGGMRKQGYLQDAKAAPRDWVTINPDYFRGENLKAPPALAKAINNYLGQGNDAIQAIAKAIGRFKGIILGAGIPKTGLNFHGVSILARDLLAGKQSVSDNALTRGIKTTYWLTRPSEADKFFKGNLEEAAAFVKQGLTLSSEEHSVADDALKLQGNAIEKSKQFLKQTYDNTEGGKLSKFAHTLTGTQRVLFEEPLFGKVMPAMKLQYAQKLTEDLVKKGMDRTVAMKQASNASNAVFGGINLGEIARAKDFQGLFRTLVLAPDWLESQFRLGKGVITGSTKNLRKAEGLPYRRLARNVLGAYIAANVLNKAMSGHYMWENPKGQQWSVDTGTKDSSGAARFVKLFGGAVDFVKIPQEIAEGLGTGDLSPAGSAIRGRLSPLASAGVSLATNTDYRNQNIFGQDKYGNKKTAAQNLQGAGNLIAGSTLPTPLQKLSQTLQGNGSAEQAVVGSIEAPISYKKAPKSGGSTLRASSGTSLKKSTGRKVRTKKSRAPKARLSKSRVKKARTPKLKSARVKTPRTRVRAYSVK